MNRARSNKRNRRGGLRFRQDTAIFMACGGPYGSRGVERRLRACTSFRLSGGSTSAFSAGVAGTWSSFWVSCVHHEMNASYEGLIYEPTCSESEPCSELRVTMAVRCSGTPFGNTGSCVFLEAMGTLVGKLGGRDVGKAYLNPSRPCRTAHRRICT